MTHNHNVHCGHLNSNVIVQLAIEMYMLTIPWAKKAEKIQLGKTLIHAFQSQSFDTQKLIDAFSWKYRQILFWK